MGRMNLPHMVGTLYNHRLQSMEGRPHRRFLRRSVRWCRAPRLCGQPWAAAVANPRWKPCFFYTLGKTCVDTIGVLGKSWDMGVTLGMPLEMPNQVNQPFNQS